MPNKLQWPVHLAGASGIHSDDALPWHSSSKLGALHIAECIGIFAIVAEVGALLILVTMLRPTLPKSLRFTVRSK